MSKKYFWAMAVMAAFVAGTIATATPVFAPPPEDDGEGGWKAAIAEQQVQIAEQQVQIAELQSSQFNQVITQPIIRLSGVSCTSDRDFLVYIAGSIKAGDPLQLDHSNGLFTGVAFDDLTIIGETIGGEAGATLTIHGPTGFITLQTESGATASCTGIS
jgi:hypothetical protein